MRYVNTRTATSLTGLTTERLREWSSRRALVPADVQRQGRGSQAWFAWQTILVLRIAVVLKEHFHLELNAHRSLFLSVRDALGTTSFLKLWGRSLAIYTDQKWELRDRDATSPIVGDAILIQLDPHLTVLAEGFSMPDPKAPGQLELFPATLVGERIQSARNIRLEIEPLKAPMQLNA